MTTRTSFVAATAIAVAGTAALAGWLALDAGEVRATQQTLAAPTVQSAPAVPAATAPPAPDAALGALAEFDAPGATDRALRAPVAAPRASVTRKPRATTPAVKPAVIVDTPSAPAAEELFEERPAVEHAVRNSPEPIEPIEPTEPIEPVVVVVPSDSILGVRLETSVTSETAEIEDRVEAAITRDVITDDRIAIPAGTRLLGSVSGVARGGKFRESAHLAVRFHTLVMDDGTRLPVRVDTIVRDGSAPTRGTAAKIGGSAIGGAIIGGIMGGKKGAVLGGIAGAGAGTAVVATGDRSVAELVEGSTLSLRLLAPVTVMIDRR